MNVAPSRADFERLQHDFERLRGVVTALRSSAADQRRQARIQHLRLVVMAEYRALIWCPECDERCGELLPMTLSNVDYFSCIKCGHVWTQPHTALNQTGRRPKLAAAAL